MAEKAQSYEKARARLFELAAEEYGHHPPPLKLRKTIEGLDRLIQLLQSERRSPLVETVTEWVRRVRAELVAIVEGKRRLA